MKLANAININRKSGGMGHPGQVIFPEWPMLKFAAEYLPEAAAITSPQFRECFGEAQAASALVPALESLPVGEMKYVAAGLGNPQRYSNNSRGLQIPTSVGSHTNVVDLMSRNLPQKRFHPPIAGTRTALRPVRFMASPPRIRPHRSYPQPSGGPIRRGSA